MVKMLVEFEFLLNTLSILNTFLCKKISLQKHTAQNTHKKFIFLGGILLFSLVVRFLLLVSGLSTTYPSKILPSCSLQIKNIRALLITIVSIFILLSVICILQSCAHQEIELTFSDHKHLFSVVMNSHFYLFENHRMKR